MSAIPHAVLSEHFQERMKGRRLRSAVFLTYQFEPAFFEQEILPVFVDIPLSHAVPIRLVQLEDALHALPGEVAVYYDANGLVAGDAGSAKLDVRRIPVQHRIGIFHPKNVFLLVETDESNNEGYRAQTLIVASLSANLTRTGWWENVEVCHVEKIAEGDKSLLKSQLVPFLRGLRRKTAAVDEHRAISDILGFLGEVTPRVHRSSSGQIHTHFYTGTESIPDFLEEAAGDDLRGKYLEIISPYFDDATSCKPLLNLIERFEPKEVRVLLPRSGSDEGLCRRELYEAVRALPNVRWGYLPKDFVRLGRSEEAGERSVHAKVYRFFTQNPKREIYFIGSANLTSAAHQSSGNVETGFLVDWPPAARPDFWLIPDDRRPKEFHRRKEDEASAASGGTQLNVRYHWDRSVAEAFWDAPGESPTLRLEARGIEVGTIPPLSPRTWTELPADITARIAELLAETSMFLVHGEAPAPGLLLIQEEGMSHKPSLLLQLSAADILRYWSLLTPEQRTAFLEARAPEIALTGQGADLVIRSKIALEQDTLFDRFAGFFHAFGCLERAVRSALDTHNEKQVDYRLFGKKYDSLGHLLDRVAAETDKGDDVDRYVIVLCARQLCQEIAKQYPEYWSRHAADVKGLGQRFEDLAEIRQRLIERNTERFEAFLEWFERWFLRRAEPVLEA